MIDWVGHKDWRIPNVYSLIEGGKMSKEIKLIDLLYMKLDTGESYLVKADKLLDLLTSLEKEKERADKAERDLQDSYNHHVPHHFVREELYKQTEEEVKELEADCELFKAIINTELDLRLKVELRLKTSEEIRMAEKKILIQEIEKNKNLTEAVYRHHNEWEFGWDKMLKVLDEVKSDLKDYTSPNLLVEQLSERIKELEAERRRDALDGQTTIDEAYNRIKGLKAQLASIKNDPSIGKLEIVDGFDVDYDQGGRGFPDIPHGDEPEYFKK